ncbi:MAG: hypothetical protein NXH73_12525, partial [Flavobacteriaceae bacterium]|nr:hypothetical protein [Flavobacteriaceae bacterium]
IDVMQGCWTTTSITNHNNRKIIAMTRTIINSIGPSGLVPTPFGCHFLQKTVRLFVTPKGAHQEEVSQEDVNQAGPLCSRLHSFAMPQNG